MPYKDALKVAPITLYLPIELRDQLDEYAHNQAITRSMAIRIAIMKHLGLGLPASWDNSAHN